MAIASHLAAVGVHHQVPHPQHATAARNIPGLGSGRPAADPPQDGGDAGLQLLGTERLGQIVVGTEIQARHPLADGIERRKKDDRNAGFGPQATTHREAIQLGQHHVEHHQIGLLPVVEAQGLLTILRADHPVAGQLQTHRQHAAHGGFIIDNQQGGALVATAISGTGGISAVGSQTIDVLGVVQPKPVIGSQARGQRLRGLVLQGKGHGWRVEGHSNEESQPYPQAAVRVTPPDRRQGKRFERFKLFYELPAGGYLGRTQGQRASA